MPAHKKKNEEIHLDIQSILTNLNKPNATDVQHYVIQNFRDRLGSDRHEALREVALSDDETLADPAALCAYSLVTYNVADIAPEEFERAIDYAKENKLAHIEESLRSMAAFVEANEERDSASMPYFKTTHFINLGAIHFHQFNGASISLPHAYMDFAGLVNSRLESANLHGASMSNAYLDNANLSKANLTRTCLDGAYLHKTTCHDADFRDASLDGTHCTDASFARANLSRAILQHANLDNASFAEAKLQYAKLDRASGERVNFSHSMLNAASLKNTTLPSSIFIYANMKAVDASNAKLTNCNFSWCSLEEANFTDADLTGSNFYYANLDNTDLTNTNLSNANLEAANIQGTRFKSTKLENTIFISKRAILSDVNSVYSQLTHWHEQIKKHPDRRQLREAILKNIIRFSENMELGNRVQLHKAIKDHACFAHRRPSIRREINDSAKFFAKADRNRDQSKPPVPFESKTQKLLTEKLLPETVPPPGPRRHRYRRI